MASDDTTSLFPPDNPDLAEWYQRQQTAKQLDVANYITTHPASEEWEAGGSKGIPDDSNAVTGPALRQDQGIDALSRRLMSPLTSPPTKQNISYVGAPILAGGGSQVAPATSPSGTNPLVPSPASSARQSVLDKIASGEANSYNEIYGGGNFTGYNDHPRQRQVITEGPHKGEYSDAAGRYQFLSSTWDAERSKLGLKDFSPASQDEAAWDLASSTYKTATGRDLLADAQAGKVDYSKLAGQWPSLAGGGGAKGGNGTTYNFNYAGGDKGDQGGPDNPAELIQNEMKLTLLRNLFPQHQITQVDYDPFKALPNAPRKVNVNEGV